MENCASVFFYVAQFLYSIFNKPTKTTVINLITYFYCLYLFILNFIYKKNRSIFWKLLQVFYYCYHIVGALSMDKMNIVLPIWHATFVHELQHYVNSVANLLRKFSVLQAQCFDKDNFNLLKRQLKCIMYMHLQTSCFSTIHPDSHRIF